MADETQARGAYGGGEMTFAEIGARLGVSHQRAIKIYQSALKKLAQDPHAIEILKCLAKDGQIISILRDLAADPGEKAMLLDLAGYHFQLRARSAECRFKQDGYF